MKKWILCTMSDSIGKRLTAFAEKLESMSDDDKKELIDGINKELEKKKND